MVVAQAQSGGAPASAADMPQKLPKWDVVSVKRADMDHCTSGAAWQFTQDGAHMVCMPLLLVMQFAWQITEPDRIAGLPDWAKSTSRWNLDAKVAAEDVSVYSALSRKEKDWMLQPLLADQFHLRVHTEQRGVSVFNLTVAKGGPKLKQATADETAKANLGVRQQGKIEGVGTTLTGLPWLLNSEVGRPVVDKTGLTGTYDFTLEFVPASKTATDETGGPSIFTAIEEQLGLKLEPAKEPMDVLVIDSIEQPTAN